MVQFEVKNSRFMLVVITTGNSQQSSTIINDWNYIVMYHFKNSC